MPSGSAELRMEGSTWYGNIPIDWSVDRFKRIATIRNGQVDPEDDRYKDLPLYAPNHIESGTGRLLEVESADTQGAESGKFLVEPGEVVYSKIRPELRKVIVAPFKGLCSADMYPVHPLYRVEARFLYYEMLSDGFSQYTLLESGRVAMPKINRKALGECIFVYPDRKQQARICEYLDLSCAAIDAAVAAKRRQLETLDALRKSTIKRAVTMGLNPSVKMQRTDVERIPEIPQHWRLVRVKDVMEFFNTVRVPLSAADRGVMTEKTYDYYGASGVIDKVEACLFDGTYILIAEDGANLLTRSKTLAFLATGKFWVNNHAHILKPRWGGDDIFFVNLLESQDFSLFVTGAAQPKLTMENLGRFKLAVPRVAEQREIAAFIHQKDKEFRPLFSQMEQQIATLTAYRKSLIHECVTGQRRVTEADLAWAGRGKSLSSRPSR